MLDAVLVQLGLLWKPSTLWQDINNDDYAEKVGFTICVSPELNDGHVWAGITNLGARLAIEAGNIVTLSSSHENDGNILLVTAPSPLCSKAAILERNSTDSWCLSGRSSLSMKKILNNLAINQVGPNHVENEICSISIEEEESICLLVDKLGQQSEINLANYHVNKTTGILNKSQQVDLISFAEQILAEDNNDPRATTLALGISMPEKLSKKCAEQVFSLMMEAVSRATSVSLPVTECGLGCSFKTTLFIEETDNNCRLTTSGDTLWACGTSSSVARMIADLSQLWFKADEPSGEKLQQWKEEIYDTSRLISGETGLSKIAYGLIKNNLSDYDDLHSEKVAMACRKLKQDIVPSLRKHKPTVHKAILPNDRDLLLEALATIDQGTENAHCQIYCSGSFNDRQSLKIQAKKILTAKGYRPEIQVIRSYKPATSWLLEEVEPNLPTEAKSLKITFAPFDKPNQMELKTRWLQEIYPAPDIVCNRRSWHLSQVEMALVEDQEIPYIVQAYDNYENIIATYSLAPPISNIPYLLEKRTDQQVYPTQSGISISFSNGADDFVFNTGSSREHFWQIFQNKWLPEIEQTMLDLLPQVQESNALAFWEEIRFTVEIDEGQEKLDFAEERIAPLEALHEDLYFGLLAFMQAFREQYCPDSKIQFGRIIPVMRMANGNAPQAKIELKPFCQALPIFEQTCSLEQLSYKDNIFYLNLGTGSPDLSPNEKEKLCSIANAWGKQLTLVEDEFIFKASPLPKYKDGDSTETDINKTHIEKPDPEIIHQAQDVNKWIKKFDSMAEMKVWQAGQTIMGRDITAVEVTSCGYMSAQRARLLKPTILINARHHANEVSGTNAAMEILYKLGFDSDFRKVLQDINVIVIPLENGDGVATFEEMLTDSPDHKLHAARYNALGLEWYDQYFEKQTPFSEAKVKSRLFDRWLPTYLLDMHGVPSHEWEQPFSGYLSPVFKEYWIPRSFIYAIIPFYEQPDHPGAIEASHLAKAMSESIESNEDIVDLNSEIYERYARYGKAFEPEIFDSNMEGTLVVVPTCERINKTNFGNKKWPLVQSEVITEVLDEVACGPWLEKCTRSHVAIAKAMMDRLSLDEKATLQRRQEHNGATFSWVKPN